MKILEFPEKEREPSMHVCIHFNDHTVLDISAVGTEIAENILNVADEDGSLHFVPLNKVFRVHVHESYDEDDSK